MVKVLYAEQAPLSAMTNILYLSISVSLLGLLGPSVLSSSLPPPSPFHPLLTLLIRVSIDQSVASIPPSYLISG